MIVPPFCLVSLLKCAYAGLQNTEEAAQ